MQQLEADSRLMSTNRLMHKKNRTLKTQRFRCRQMRRRTLKDQHNPFQKNPNFSKVMRPSPCESNSLTNQFFKRILDLSLRDHCPALPLGVFPVFYKKRSSFNSRVNLEDSAAVNETTPPCQPKASDPYNGWLRSRGNQHVIERSMAETSLYIAINTLAAELD